MKFATCLLNVALLAATVQAQTSCLKSLLNANDELDTCKKDLEQCQKTPHGSVYESLNNCIDYDDGIKVRVRGDRAYKTFCDSRNQRGGSLGSPQQAPNVDECMITCNNTPRCVGGDYYHESQKCYLKETGETDDVIDIASGSESIAFYRVGYV